MSPPAPRPVDPPAPTGDRTAPGPSRSDQPAAVRPQDARPQRAVSKAPPTAPPHQGDLICGECGEGNAPTRRFCSRCGGSLSTARPVRIPWWRRLLPRRRAGSGAGAGTPTAAGTAAGTAPRRRKSRRMPAFVQGARRLIGLVLVLGGIVYATFTPFRSWVNEHVDRAAHRVESTVRPQYVPVHPVEATATAAGAGHPAGATIDGFTNTYWAAPATGPEQVLVLRFDHPVDVQKALVRVGVSGNFGATHRPREVHVVYSTGRSQDLTLDDSADAQEVTLKTGGRVTTIELHITSFYRAVSGTDLAITEIELFARK
ncbi:zinc ribbon domain-containing protein [Planosporangium sp. 12N6]|uniref:zinc ribbon domain-containing protein n=1 Tax=Planosporangium spinosum TaxID=3402278 RepID=UPI003CF71768